MRQSVAVWKSSFRLNVIAWQDGRRLTSGLNPTAKSVTTQSAQTASQDFEPIDGLTVLRRFGQDTPPYRNLILLPGRRLTASSNIALAINASDESARISSVSSPSANDLEGCVGEDD